MASFSSASWFRKYLQSSNRDPAASDSNVNIASPSEHKLRSFEQRAAMEGVRKGARAAAAACVVTAIPTVLGARMMPSRARFYLNYRAQVSIISAATMAAYFIVADKATLSNARQSSQKRIMAERAASASRSV